MEVHVDSITEQSRGGLHAPPAHRVPNFTWILNFHGDLSIWSSV
jgi:hypothetical protein